MEEPDRPVASPCLLAYSGSALFATTREYFRGGSRLSGHVCQSVGGWSARGVAEVEAGGAVEGVFGETGEGAGGQDGVFVPVFAGEVHREAPAGG